MLPHTPHDSLCTFGVHVTFVRGAWEADPFIYLLAQVDPQAIPLVEATDGLEAAQAAAGPSNQQPQPAAGQLSDTITDDPGSSPFVQPDNNPPTCSHSRPISNPAEQQPTADLLQERAIFIQNPPAEASSSLDASLPAQTSQQVGQSNAASNAVSLVEASAAHDDLPLANSAAVAAAQGLQGSTSQPAGDAQADISVSQASGHPAVTSVDGLSPAGEGQSAGSAAAQASGNGMESSSLDQRHRQSMPGPAAETAAPSTMHDAGIASAVPLVQDLEGNANDAFLPSVAIEDDAPNETAAGASKPSPGQSRQEDAHEDIPKSITDASEAEAAAHAASVAFDTDNGEMTHVGHNDGLDLMTQPGASDARSLLNVQRRPADPLALIIGSQGSDAEVDIGV